MINFYWRFIQGLQCHCHQFVGDLVSNWPGLRLDSRQKHIIELNSQKNNHLWVNELFSHFSSIAISYGWQYILLLLYSTVWSWIGLNQLSAVISPFSTIHWSNPSRLMVESPFFSPVFHSEKSTILDGWAIKKCWSAPSFFAEISQFSVLHKLHQTRLKSTEN